VPPDELSPERLRRAVDEVRADPAYRSNARRMAAVIARYDGARAAGRAILGLLGRSPEPPAPSRPVTAAAS
jgi:UDP:flavonoid glycosyltransferase YjiC (YdhE family)